MVSKLNNMEKISLQLDFKPASQFKYYNLIMVAGVVLISGIILLLGLAFEFFIFEGFEINVTALLIAVIAIVVLIVALWNELYYKSIVYNLNNTEMTWKRGVWFRQTGIVPYSRITNVDIAQGPLMRLFKISDVKIQTASSSAQNLAEIRINGMEEPEHLREMIMKFVRSGGVSGAATGGSDDTYKDSFTDNQVVSELKEMKKLLEKIAQK